QTFDSSLSAVERTALDRVRSFWNQSGVKPWEHGQATTSKKAEVKVVEKRFSVSAGEAATLFSHSQGGRILGIEIERDFPNWGSGVLLEALWDNDKLPGV